MTTNLSGRALAEAAAKVMEMGPLEQYGGKDGKWFWPDDPNDDYKCLEWARGNCDYTIIIKMTNYLRRLWSKRCYERHTRTENWSACTAYLPGDYARALVAAASKWGASA